jgi:hypothetical protein
VRFSVFRFAQGSSCCECCCFLDSGLHWRCDGHQIRIEQLNELPIISAAPQSSYLERTQLTCSFNTLTLTPEYLLYSSRILLKAHLCNFL